MKYAVCYSKAGGNTEILANACKECLGSDLIYYGKLDDEALAADIIFIGFWTIRGCCDDLCKEFLSKLTNQRVFLFGTAGYGLSMDYFNDIIAATLDYLSDGVEVLNTFMCQGRMKMAVREKYEALKKSNPNDKNTDMMIKNFDMALKHPDSNDIANLKKLVMGVVK